MSKYKTRVKPITQNRIGAKMDGTILLKQLSISRSGLKVSTLKVPQLNSFLIEKKI